MDHINAKIDKATNMPFGSATARRNAGLKKDAEDRRIGMEHKKRAPAAHNRKMAARLEARVKGWELTMNQPKAPSPMAYHKPGAFK